jgi:ribose/xylose/arabinose/galactoside ABC-type transport system permease subunit
MHIRLNLCSTSKDELLTSDILQQVLLTGIIQAGGILCNCTECGGLQVGSLLRRCSFVCGFRVQGLLSFWRLAVLVMLVTFLFVSPLWEVGNTYMNPRLIWK